MTQTDNLNCDVCSGFGSCNIAVGVCNCNLTESVGVWSQFPDIILPGANFDCSDIIQYIAANTSLLNLAYFFVVLQGLTILFNVFVVANYSFPKSPMKRDAPLIHFLPQQMGMILNAISGLLFAMVNIKNQPGSSCNSIVWLYSASFALTFGIILFKLLRFDKVRNIAF